MGLPDEVTWYELARITDVLGTVLNTSWLAPKPEMVDGLNTPFRVTETSASKRMFSFASLLIPVTFWTARGVVIEKFVISSELDPDSTCGVGVESEMVMMPPRPLTFATANLSSEGRSDDSDSHRTDRPSPGDYGAP